MRVRLIVVSAIAAALFVAPAFAHHSFSMFDADKTVTLTGTVKEFEWTNPHAWLRIMVNDQTAGKAVQYALEMGSPGQQSRVGWKPDSVKPGDKVTVTRGEGPARFARLVCRIGRGAWRRVLASVRRLPREESLLARARAPDGSPSLASLT